MPNTNPVLMTAEADRRLRVAIKWDALERDETAVVERFRSEGEVQRKRALALFLAECCVYVSAFLHLTIIFRGLAKWVLSRRKALRARAAYLAAYLAESDLESHDLDLWCCGYDADGTMTLCMSPQGIVQDTHGDAAKAFIHSGDETSGISTEFDEYFLVALRDMPESLTQVFFIVTAACGDFKAIEGGEYALMSTKHEKKLFKGVLKSSSTDHVCVLAALVRSSAAGDHDAGWMLRDINRTYPMPSAGQKHGIEEQLGSLLEAQGYLDAEADDAADQPSAAVSSGTA